MSSIQVRYISFMMLFTLMLSACALPLQDSAEKTIYIGPAMVECEGEGPQMCLQVKENPQEADSHSPRRYLHGFFVTRVIYCQN